MSSVKNCEPVADVNRRMSTMTLVTESRRPDADFARRKSFMANETPARRTSRSTVSNSTEHNSQHRPSLYGLGHSMIGLKQLTPTAKPIGNTYKLGPADGEMPLTSIVQNVVSDVINSKLNNVSYAKESSSGKLVCDLSAAIKQAVKCYLPCSRYKVMCNVLMSQATGQGLHTASRCVWNPETDNFTSVHYNNNGLNLVAIVHWVYFE